MAIPSIAQTDGAVGFHWRDPAGRPGHLADLADLPDAEPHRWLPTHLEALDDVLIDVATRLGPVLGGEVEPSPTDLADVRDAHLAIDRASREYAVAAAALDLPRDLRAGQILGTGALLSIQCREVLGTIGPSPFAGSLDSPGVGMVSGRAVLSWVEAGDDQVWQGARWVVETEDGLRLPATLAMLLHDSSGVLKDAAVTEHKDALARITTAVESGPVEPIQASGAVDWLLFDWLMAHRDGPQSAAVEITSGKVEDATMIVEAVGASVGVRSLFDPELVALPRG